MEKIIEESGQYLLPGVEMQMKPRIEQEKPKVQPTKNNSNEDTVTISAEGIAPITFNYRTLKGCGL
jgi:hypothetical protein